MNKQNEKGAIQFHGSTSIGVLESLVEVLLVQEDCPGDQPQRRVAPDGGIREPLLQAGDRRFLQTNEIKPIEKHDRSEIRRDLRIQLARN